MMKKKLVIALIGLAIVIIGMGIAYYLFNKPVPDISKSKATYSISAHALLSEFEGDLNSATKKYVNEVLKITGKVQSVTITNESINIQLGEQGDFFGVNCSFPIEQQTDFKTIQNGDQIEVKGECQGYIDDVIINNCILVK